jgi:parallel beta-helix repeat protein
MPVIGYSSRSGEGASMKCTGFLIRSVKLLFPAIAVLFMLVVSGGASAATYYVNNSASPACSNTAGQPGTLAAPFCTVGYGISRMSGGDTLYVRTGKYNEAISITGPSGTAANPTVISAYPGDSPAIVGPGVNNARIHFTGISYMTFNGFDVSNFNQGIFCDTCAHFTISNNVVHNIGQEGIHVHVNSSYVMVSGNTVHDTGVWQYDGEGIYIGTGTGGPADTTNNITISGNTIYNTTDEGVELKGGTHDCLVDGNTLHNNNSANNGYGGASIELDEGVPSWYSSNPNQIVRNNTVYAAGPGSGPTNINSGIRAGTGATVYNNVIYSINSFGDGIFTDNPANDSYTRRIYHNTIDVPSSRAFVNNGGTADVRNNIGPTSANNLTTNNAYYVNQAAANYRLAGGSAPINAGVDLTAIVPTDIVGFSRLLCPPPDLGAYEYNCGSRPAPPTNLTAIPH